jgi:hypothetical protein
VLTVAGFGIAIWQLVRTARASEATKIAVERTERRMALNHLLVLLPQFRILEHDLDAAADGNDRNLAMRTLVSFNYLSSEIAGLLTNQDGIDPNLSTQLQSIGRVASLAKADMINNPSKQAKTATKDFRKQLADVTAHVGALIGQFRIEPHGS